MMELRKQINRTDNVHRKTPRAVSGRNGPRLLRRVLRGKPAPASVRPALPGMRISDGMPEPASDVKNNRLRKSAARRRKRTARTPEKSRRAPLPDLATRPDEPGRNFRTDFRRSESAIEDRPPTKRRTGTPHGCRHAGRTHPPQTARSTAAASPACRSPAAGDCRMPRRSRATTG